MAFIFRNCRQVHLCVCCLLAICIGLSATGCAAQLDREWARKFARAGEAGIVFYNATAVTQGIAQWAQTLTNGYTLCDNAETRLRHMSLESEPGILFSLVNLTNAISAWGFSECLPRQKSVYWADIVIRIVPVTGGTRIAVAIHGSHFVRGVQLNIHTLRIEGEREADIHPCPADERKLLNSLLMFVKQTAR